MSKKQEFKLNVYMTTHFEPRHEETNNVVFEQVSHTPSCTSTEDGWRLEISNLESSGIVLPV